MTQRTVAVVGGGLRGLSAAYSLSKTPNLRVILYEQGDLGGWAGSTRRDLDDGRYLVVEKGPRSIRPNGVEGWSTVNLALQLGLESEIVSVAKDGASAKNRFVLLDGKLVKMPSSLSSGLWALGANKTVRGAASEVMRALVRRKPVVADDCSIYDMVHTLAGPHSAQLATAMVHGIYSGSAREISARWAMPSFFYKNRPDALRYQERTERDAEKLKELQQEISAKYPGAYAQIDAASVWSLAGGLKTLVSRLASEVRQNGVQIVNKRAELSFDGASSLCLNGEVAPDYTLLAADTALLPPEFGAPAIPSTTVGVVSLAYDPSHGQVPTIPEGFGYLIPSRDNNPHEALGVIFDSHVMPGVDNSGWLKVSVMIGGDFWLDGVPKLPKDALIERAVKTLNLHLPQKDDGWSMPSHVSGSLLRNCIPQVPVGTIPKMQQVAQKIDDFNETSPQKLLMGTWPVGVNWAVRGGLQLADNTISHATGMSKSIQSGLEMWKTA